MHSIESINNTADLRTVEIIPAILAKTKEALLDAINKVSPYVKTIHIDIMDNKFVPNLTIGLEELKKIPPNLSYEFHWMVSEPEKWIDGIKNINESNIHIIHIETIDGNLEKIRKIVSERREKLGLAINPDTSLAKILPYAKNVERILVMGVKPGFSGQKYIKNVETKISILRKMFPKLNIEVDGGINTETLASAIAAGANKIITASAVFSQQNVDEAIKKLRKIADECAH